MSTPIAHSTANSDSNIPIPETWEEIPCVQYGFESENGQSRSPKLQTIFDSTPEGAITVSPIYILDRGKYLRQDRFTTGYEISGGGSIATELQNECENDPEKKRVLYPIHVESDELKRTEPETLITWYREFIEEWLGVPFDSCSLYYSGSRSIHVHVPRFVSGEKQRERLKETAEEFCKQTGAKLDCGLYGAKRMFRLPGVKHSKTGLPKVEIRPDWNRTRIIRESAISTIDVPDTYETLLREVFLQPSLIKNPSNMATYTPHLLFHVLDSDKTVLEVETKTLDTEIPLIEQKEYPDDVTDVPMWAQYNAKEFSPYALARRKGRSVAVVEVKGSPFARKEVTGGQYNTPVHALIPAYFHGARGCSGGEFTKESEHAPLQLSKPDYEKWRYDVGDHVVIIGGQSKESRIFAVTPGQATIVGEALTGENGCRQTALAYLKNEGYDVGKSGSDKNGRSKSSAARKYTSSNKGNRNPPTQAGLLQQRAEREGIHKLSHIERSRVACRLLRQGWDPAWNWFEEQFDPEFKPGLTWTNLRNIVNYYPDYDHVVVPPKPR